MTQRVKGIEGLGKAERKRFRKDIRKNLLWHSFRESIDDAWQHLFDEYLCVLFWKKRLRRSLEYTRNAMNIGMTKSGVVMDYTPGSLSKVDEAIIEIKDEIARGIDVPSKNIELGFIEGIGSYFGEVVIRNMGGTWFFPPRTRLWAGRLHKDMSLFYDLWYVELSGSRIYALKTARLFWEGGRKAVSLAEAYRQISETGIGAHVSSSSDL